MSYVSWSWLPPRNEPSFNSQPGIAALPPTGTYHLLDSGKAIARDAGIATICMVDETHRTLPLEKLGDDRIENGTD